MAPALSAQLVDEPGPGSWRLRATVLPSVQNWRYAWGAGGAEPLGAALTDPAVGPRLLPHLAPLEDLLGGGGAVRLGTLRATRSTTVVTIPARVEVGLAGFLSLGVTVPVVRRRIEADLDFTGEGATVGFSPALDQPGQVASFLSELSGLLAEGGAAVAQLCQGSPGSPECSSAQQRLVAGQALQGRLTALYAAPLAPLPDSPAGSGLQEALDGLVAALQALGVIRDPGPVPLAREPLSPAAFRRLLEDPGLGVELEPLSTVQRPWALGDVEVHVNATLLRRLQVDSAGSLQGRETLVGIATLRLPTGESPSPEAPLDPGTGGGTRDLVLGLEGDLARLRWGIRAALRYSVRGEAEEVRRIAPPEGVLAGVELRRPVLRSAGNVLELEVVPRVALTPDFGIGLGWWHRRVGEDRYSGRSTVPSPSGELAPQIPDPSVLAPGTGGTLGMAVFTLSYSTLRPRAEGRYAGWPFEVLVRVEQATTASGGIMAPKGTRFQGGLRLFR